MCKNLVKVIYNNSSDRIIHNLKATFLLTTLKSIIMKKCIKRENASILLLEISRIKSMILYQTYHILLIKIINLDQNQWILNLNNLLQHKRMRYHTFQKGYRRIILVNKHLINLRIVNNQMINASWINMKPIIWHL